MPDFRTILKIAPAPARIALSERIFTIGSCFADVVGNKLARVKMQTAINTAGTIYNPVSIHRTLRLATSRLKPSEANYINGEFTAHYDFHSSVAANSPDALGRTLETLLENCHTALRQTNWLIITYGSAWVYSRRDTGEIVANCHKQPARLFSRSLLTTDQIEASFRALLTTLLTLRPDLKIILTVSPVRHIRDTLEGNAVGKSVLRVACHNMVSEHPSVYYFPAYEIMMDDLRDYRFYGADMIHPNDVAEEYIWEKFAAAWFDDRLQQFVADWKEILLALNHRPFHPHTKTHRRFLMATRQKIEAWSGTVDVTDELDIIDKQLLTQ